LLPDERVAIVTPPRLQAARRNPIDVAEGVLDVAFTTPSVTAAMATRGVGLYHRPYPSLRAIAAYPHDDFLLFAVDAATGIESIDDLAAFDRPLRIATGRGGDGADDDVLTYVADRVLRRHGTSYAAIRERGGDVVYAESPFAGGRLLLDGDVDVLVQEAQSAPFWRELGERGTVRFLPVPDDTRAALADELGLRSAAIPTGHNASVAAPVPTIDFTGWLLFCRDDLPGETAYALARAVDETRPKIEAGDPVVRAPLTLPVDPLRLFTETAIPLHDGAAAYARERGYLS
jgi:hypothetical protein